MNAYVGSPIDVLLPRLEGVQSAGKGYRALCPSCGGESRKVSIAKADNGTVLLHAFCGCSPAEVVGAVGLTLADLFPRRLADLSPLARAQARAAMRESGWAAALTVLAREATVVLIAARMIAKGTALTDADDTRLAVAVDRIDGARQVLA